MISDKAQERVRLVRAVMTVATGFGSLVSCSSADTCESIVIKNEPIVRDLVNAPLSNVSTEVEKTIEKISVCYNKKPVFGDSTTLRLLDVRRWDASTDVIMFDVVGRSDAMMIYLRAGNDVIGYKYRP